MNEIENYNQTTLESIKHVDEYGNEYWEARELQKVLAYVEWRKFERVIDKATETCNNSNYTASEHFVGADKTIPMPKSATKIVKDYHLSRYACYLIVQNGDSRKKEIAAGQTYFAIQTRKQELTEEEYKQLSEDEIRLKRRKEVTHHNKTLSGVAKQVGVKDYAKFNNAGYQGLYNGETATDIKKRKKLRDKESILDYMDSEELGANIFRITQTEAKIKREQIKGEETATDTHYEVGLKVRKAIQDIGGTMPENIPTPKKSIKEITNANKVKIGTK